MAKQPEDMIFDDLKNACDAFVLSEYFSGIALSFSIPPVFLEYFPSIALVFL